MDIDAVIAEATQVAPAQEATTVAPIDKTPKQEAEVTNDTVETVDDAVKPDSELTPEQLVKREANRQSHQNSREAKLRREVRELREFRAQTEAKQAQPAQVTQNTNGMPQKPKEENYNSFMDFLEAKDDYFEKLSDWKVEQKLSELSQKSQPQVDNKMVERIQQIAQQKQEFAQRNPEYEALAVQNSDFFENMPKHIEAAFLKADNPTMAAFALMKEGSLQDLEDLPADRVDMVIGRAEERGKVYLNSVKTATNASTPIQSLKGTSSATKPLEKKSVEELMKQFNS